MQWEGFFKSISHSWAPDPCGRWLHTGEGEREYLKFRWICSYGNDTTVQEVFHWMKGNGVGADYKIATFQAVGSRVM